MVKTIFENIREEMIVEIQFNYENWEGSLEIEWEQLTRNFCKNSVAWPISKVGGI